MKKKMRWILIMLTITVALILLLLPSDVNVTVKVQLPLERVMAEFETTDRVKKWLIPADSGYILTIQKANPFEFIFLHEKEGNQTPLHFVVSPDTTDSKITKIIYRYNNNFFGGKSADLRKLAAHALNALEDSLNSTGYVYGYEIREATVTDSSFLFQQVVVKRDEEQQGTKQLFDELIAYAEKRGAGYNGVRIFYSQPMPDSRVALFGSIGVNIYTPTRPDENIQYKMMPYGKKLLIMDYEGPYGKTKELYSVLEEFKRNNNLVSMAIPFQKFLSAGYGFADSQVVKTRISYPVF